MKNIFALVLIAALAFSFASVPIVSANQSKETIVKEEISKTPGKSPCKQVCINRPGRATPKPLCHCSSTSAPE
jgi:hypothetical protein